MPCFMCSPDPDSIVAENDLALAVRDAFPVSPGHTLVITKRHAEAWFDATKNEQSAVLELVDEVKRALDDELHPGGFNIGLNVGEAAGQTIPHLHVHVIPRFAGDVDDPTGGVRLAIPDKGNYRRPGFVPSTVIEDQSYRSAAEAAASQNQPGILVAQASRLHSSCELNPLRLNAAEDGRQPLRLRGLEVAPRRPQHRPPWEPKINPAGNTDRPIGVHLFIFVSPLLILFECTCQNA